MGEKTAARLAMHLLRAPEGRCWNWPTPCWNSKKKFGSAGAASPLRTRNFVPCAPIRPGSQGQLLVVADPGDLLAMEKVGWFQGHYHVLGGLISPLEGVGPDDIRIRELLERITAGGIRK